LSLRLFRSQCSPPQIILHTPPPGGVHIRFDDLRRREFHAKLAHIWPQVEAMLKTHEVANV